MQLSYWPNNLAYSHLTFDLALSIFDFLTFPESVKNILKLKLNSKYALQKYNWKKFQ